MAKKPNKARKSKASTKSGQIIRLLSRPSGASIPELVKTTGWQAHSVRGFLSGTLKKKMALDVTSSQDQGRDRRYRLVEKA